MRLSSDLSWHNYYAFIWHTSFLALAMNFMDVDTVIPAMLIEAGGNGLHIGLMTAIMFGGSSFTQLIFAPFLSNHAYKKKFLLLGINARIVSLLEVSGTENRVLYTGIAGAGNILPALFPILGGWIIEQFGFQWFFILFTVMISISLFFIRMNNEIC